jgi:D-serine deaminase-like pyridoxal phosphate-dependent protein
VIPPTETLYPGTTYPGQFCRFVADGKCTHSADSGLRDMIEAAMAAHKFMLSDFPWDECHRVAGIEDVLTPALVIYPEIVASNIARTLHLLGGDPDRWRVHIKTAKLAYTLRMLVERCVRSFKCATTLELLVACYSGAADVLLAYPVVGASARRVFEIANQFPHVRISVLVENEEQVRQWRGSSIDVFVDINPGMNRTGVEQGQTDKVVRLVHAVEAAELQFGGLHYYDGQYGGLDEPERTAATHGGYDRLLQLVIAIQGSGMSVPEVVTAGTPTFPCSLSYKGFHGAGFIHRVSPGTIVYCDATSLAQLPAEYGYSPAALVLTRVVSRPHDGIITCDAGHKAVSADAGVPTCVVAGHPELTPLAPSEEHLPMAVSPILNRETAGPQVGKALYLLPRHVCPTVNNFDSALLVRDGQIASVEKVTARGREAPLLPTFTLAKSSVGLAATEPI